MSRPHHSSRSGTRWAVRIIPLFIVGILAVATYAVVGRLCSVVPLAPEDQTEREAAEKVRKRHKRNRDVEERAYVPPDPNPDSPGLEAFYSKDVFICEVDGRPKWCSECQQWKPDRSHHSSDLGRCVRKMDHFCPWVGGMVSETSFNFFTQFCFYCGLFCAVGLAVGAYSFQQHHKDGDPTDGWALATIVLACVFGTFTFGMALTSFRFILSNTTNVDMLKRSSSEGQQPHNNHGPISARDQLAERKFAILRTKPRENPWNLGAKENWKSVMGDNFLEWMLPIRHSPCCNHENMESDYKFGPLIAKLRKRYGVPELEAPSRGGHGIELQERGSRRASD
ncbi:hypothetical protein TrVFT333_001900 [Trichoderma virens FT-333]|nr:hypothetical protein TrVFT333_001900 [Trichoderma virens FT-333]